MTRKRGDPGSRIPRRKENRAQLRFCFCFSTSDPTLCAKCGAKMKPRVLVTNTPKEKE